MIGSLSSVDISQVVAGIVVGALTGVAGMRRRASNRGVLEKRIHSLEKEVRLGLHLMARIARHVGADDISEEALERLLQTGDRRNDQ